MKNLIDIINTENVHNILQQETRGGTRKNAGAKALYYEPTVTVSVKCPASKAAELKDIIKILLKQLQKQNPHRGNGRGKLAYEKSNV